MQNESAPAAHVDVAFTGVPREELGNATDEPFLPFAAASGAVSGGEGARSIAIERDGGVLIVDTHETVWSLAEADGAGEGGTCTLGMVRGALECMFGKRCRAVHVESVRRGGSRDVLRLGEH